MADASRLDPSIAAAVATLVAAANDATLVRGDPFAELTAEDLAFLVAHARPGTPMRPDDAPLAQLLGPGPATDLERARDALSRIDTAALARSHLTLATGVDHAVALLQHAHVRAAGDVYETDTPYGRILVRGEGNDHYASGEDYFLTIDLGGDDTYANRAGASKADLADITLLPLPPSPTDPGFPAWTATALDLLHRTHNASIAIDLTGDDVYATASDGAQGFGAWGGFGALVDLEGNDAYSGATFAQGAGQTAGVGFLIDAEGSDSYHAIQQAQGFAIDAGAGILADGIGRDTYTAEVLAQGTGYSLNLVGLLLDVAGNDRYDCTSERDFRDGILAVAAARPGSICHASGFGGTGILIDLAGNDLYLTFSSFQAMALLGVGILVDLAGDDRYLAGEWSHAVAVLGAAVILDGEGDDTYASDHRQLVPWGDIYLGSHGEGYQGAGILADRAGDDTYTASARKDLWLTQYACSAGCAFNLGVGLLLEGDGNDRYTSEVGQGGAVYGIAALLDAGGDDTYQLTHGSTRGQGYAGEDHVLFTDEGLTHCWYGLLADLGGVDTYSNPVTDFGTRTDHAHWGQGDFGRGIDDTDGAQSYLTTRLLEDLNQLIQTRACNQLGV